MIEIFIGEPISHASERKFLEKLCDHLYRKTETCLVLANFELNGRQFDFVVLTSSGVHVVDAKSVASPIKGEINGQWQRLLPDGQWVNYTNAYQQVLDCKNRLRNSMPHVPHYFYPDGHVVFVENLPTSSVLTKGNFKVWIDNFVDFFNRLNQGADNPWSFDQWRNYAMRLGLTKVEVNEAFDERGSELLRRYRNGFINDYQSEADKWLSENEDQVEALFKVAKDSKGCFIRGTSGCGKTLAAKHVGVKFSREGAIVFFIAAKTFSGSLSDTLRAEVSLVSDLNYLSLIKVISKKKLKPYFIIDGLNELSEDSARTVLRGLKALSRRYDAKIIAVSQLAPPTALASLEVFEISAPSIALKQRIAQISSSVLNTAALQVLAVVQSGLEAKIVGEMQSKLGGETTRSNLIDQYIRHRFGKNARQGTAVLRHLATWLIERIAFSVSETEFDIRISENGFALDNCDSLFDAAILVQRSGRVSFAHEMYYYSCAAHGYAALAEDDPKSIGKLLNNPVYRPLAAEVISAIESESSCLNVLGLSADANLLVDAADGVYGRIAERATQKLLKQARTQVQADIESAVLKIKLDKRFGRVDWGAEVKIDFLPEERAQYQAIGRRAARGTEVEDYLSLCRLMDQRLEQEKFRLQEQAREHKIPLKTDSFQLAYLHFGSEISFSIVAGNAKSNFTQQQSDIFFQKRSLASLSSGELYFFLENTRLWENNNKDWFARELLAVLTDRFRYEPYHVKSSILDNVGQLGDTDQHIIDQLIDAVETIDDNSLGWLGGTIILDTLKGLGALDQEAEAQRSSVQSEIQKALSGADNEDVYELALRVYGATYDHPFEGTYCEEIYALPPVQLKKLYKRALQASSIKQSFSLIMLIDEVAQLDEPDDSHIFSQFTTLPSKDTLFPQNAVASFVIATRFLARHNQPLPAIEIQDDYDRCFALFRNIIYSQQLNGSKASQAALDAWQDLEKLPITLAISCFHGISEALGFGGRNFPHAKAFPTINLLEIYSEEILVLIRNFIGNGKPAKSENGYDDDAATSYAFHIIGKYGDRGDVASLRNLIASPKLAENALSAIKSIETGRK